MMHKPKLAGVPTWLTDYWLKMLKSGSMGAYDQRELYKALRHKWSGKPGMPPLTSFKSARQLKAFHLEFRVQNEIRKLKKEKGEPPPGGYRAAALDTIAEAAVWKEGERTIARAAGWKDGEALDRWLRRNRVRQN
jgi:hypothetical protein